MFIGSVSDFTRPRGVYNHSKWYPSDVLEVFEHLEVRKHLLMTARGSQRIGNFAVISTWKGSQYLVWTDFWWFSPINHTFCPQKHVLFIPARFRHPTMTYVNQVYEKRHSHTCNHYIQLIFWNFRIISSKFSSKLQVLWTMRLVDIVPSLLRMVREHP